MSGRVFIVLGALSAAAAVGLGAFGAHALEAWLKTNDPRGNFDTAVRYQMFHAVGLVLVGLTLSQQPNRLLTAAGWLLVAGTLLFSGGLYGWLFTAIKPFVAIVPVGGTAWIVGWVCLALGAWRR